MREVENIFGKGVLHDESDLTGKIGCICCACMSVYSDYLSWANHTVKNVILNFRESDTMIILGCQVTDLAILNDLSILEAEIDQNPDKKFFVGGCLGKRFDIPLPDGVLRLDTIRKNKQPIIFRYMIDFVSPFWIQNSLDTKTDRSQGYLFRYSYPLRIGSGCQNNCAYCTIRETRGEFCELYPDESSINELLYNKDVVLIADSPSVNLLYEWCRTAIDTKKQISIRNVEPNVICDAKIWNILLEMASKKLLNTIHIPVQSTNPDTLKDMGRSVKSVNDIITYMIPLMKKADVFTATNIIIDYKNYPNSMDVYDIFDYISYNPYWNNIWDIDKAKERYEYYIHSQEFKQKYPRLRE